MNRRTFVAAAVAGVGGLAGCLTEEGLEVASVAAETTDDGAVLGTVTVRNAISSADSGTLVGTLEFETGDEYETSEEVAVPGESTETFELPFEVEDRESLQGAEYTFSASIE